jgi:hypothetical protein
MKRRGFVRLAWMATGAVALQLLTGAVRAQQPPCSWRGVDGSGVFPAQNLVTAFHDFAADMTIET